MSRPLMNKVFRINDGKQEDQSWIIAAMIV